MLDYYYTIQSPSKGFYSDKGSKFHAFIYPIDNEEQFKEVLDELKKRYYDARHHVFAYAFGYDREQVRANDDGEPSNSSGMPILGQIKSHNLTNVAIIVVRYFGGTKLGIPGLINAYKSASIDAINNSKIIKKTIDQKYKVIFEYPEMGFVQNIIKELNLNVLEQNFAEDCNIIFTIRKSEAKRVENEFIKNHKVILKTI